MEELTPALQGKTKTTFSFPAPSSVCDCSAPHLGRKILHFLPRVMGSCGRVWSRGVKWSDLSLTKIALTAVCCVELIREGSHWLGVEEDKGGLDHSWS